MGHVSETVITWIMACSLIHLGLQSLSQLVDVAARASHAWTEEYFLRRDALREAARHNIVAAAHVLGQENPDKKSAIEGERDTFCDMLDTLYPDLASARHTMSIHPDGTHCSQEIPLCFTLKLESHAGQPIPWPNWIPSLSLPKTETEVPLHKTL